MMFRLSNILVLIIFFSACQYFIKTIDAEEYFEKIDLKTNRKYTAILFSHNINGETHPCGCRKFPLGGTAQVAGLIHAVKKNYQTIYLDIGDALFPSPVLTEHNKESLKFTATTTVKIFEKLGLNYFVPGENDMSAGWDFLKNISQHAKFTFLVSNLKTNTDLKHKKWVKIKAGEKTFFLMAVTHPDTLYTDRERFIDPKLAIKQVLSEMKQNGFDENDPTHRVFLLSHSGSSKDKEYANDFPRINWIIGSHDSMFYQKPYPVGKSQMVQVLSKNHYLGYLRIPLAKNVTKERYKALQVDDEAKDKLKPNPFIAFIEKYKSELKTIQEKEQSRIYSLANQKVTQKLSTTNYCMDCHTDQMHHYAKTSHALAYQTLIRVNEDKNLTCVKCHSLGAGQAGGFQTAADIIQFSDPIHQKKYWKEYAQIMAPLYKKSLRKLPSKQISAYVQKWQKLDHKHQTTYNFANVQCLNCHNKNTNHPFEVNQKTISKMQRQNEIKKNCLNCHIPDQTPAWYTKKGQLKKALFSKAYQKISCPKKSE